jgi:asparagine synthase (glutamine-hydrolysing)
MINSLSPLQWDSVFKLLPQKFKYNNIGDKLYKVASILPLNNEQTIYRELVSQWSSPGEIVRDAQEIKTVAIENNLKNTVSNFTSRMQLMDMISYLPDDILVKLDRASMAVGLEARVPLLDHRIVEFALKLPIDMKQRNGKSKWLLRQLLHRYVPSEIVERPKMGFSIPIGDWLRGPLREWSQDLLSSEQLKKHDFFKSDIVQTYLNEHMKGHRNHQYKLWVLLMFQSWYLKWHS